MNKIFSDYAWDDYLRWQKEDKKTLNKINELQRHRPKRTRRAGASKAIKRRFGRILEQRHR